MVMLLGALAHNVPVWARAWLRPKAPRLAGFGALRLVRDVLGISGLVQLDADGAIVGIILNKGAPQANYLAETFRLLLSPQQIALSVGNV